MAQIDNTNLTNYLNKIINPTVKTQVYGKSLLWQKFGGFKADDATGLYQENNVKGVDQISFKNNTFYITVRTGRVSTTGIPVGGKVLYGQLATAQGNISPVISTGAFQMPKSVLNYKDAGAIVRPLTESMSAVIDSLSMDLNRQCYGDGTATLAYTAASGSSTTTVSLKPRNTLSTRYNGDIALDRYFPVGTYVKIGSNSSTYVTAVASNSITIAAAQTFGLGDAIVKQNGDGSATAPELDGLLLQVGTGTYAAIDPSTTPSWKSYVDLNSNTARTMANSLTALNKAFMNTCVVGKGSDMFINITEAQKYAEQFTSLVRFSYTDALGGGWAGFEFMGGNAKVVVDNDCPDDAVFMVDPRDLHRAQLQGLEWEPGNNMGGMRIAQQIDIEYIVDAMWQTYTDRRASHAVLREIVG